MASRKQVTPSLVGDLAAFAELPLGKGRESVIQPILEAWIKDANELSRKMSAEKHRDLIPVTVFRHPEEPEEGG